MSTSKQLNSQEFRVTKCELCGSPVKITGKTTQHYKPIAEKQTLPIEYNSLLSGYAEMQTALELIAIPARLDGTYNRDREACGELARVTLKKISENNWYE